MTEILSDAGMCALHLTKTERSSKVVLSRDELLLSARLSGKVEMSQQEDIPCFAAQVAKHLRTRGHRVATRNREAISPSTNFFHVHAHGVSRGFCGLVARIVRMPMHIGTLEFQDPAERDQPWEFKIDGWENHVRATRIVQDLSRVFGVQIQTSVICQR